MQAMAMRERMEQVIPEWCAANGFGDDPVILSTFAELAARLLSVLPGEPSQDTCAPTLEFTIRPDDECLLEPNDTNDSITQSCLRPFAKGEHLRPQSRDVPGVSTTGRYGGTEPAGTAHGQPAYAEWMPDCSGDWRPFMHGDEWWVLGHYMMYPARNESDAERLCQELTGQH